MFKRKLLQQKFLFNFNKNYTIKASNSINLFNFKKNKFIVKQHRLITTLEKKCFSTKKFNPFNGKI